MRIIVKTAGLLGEHLPPGSVRNRAELVIPEGATPLDVIAQLGMPSDGRYLVAVNGEIVPERRRPITALHENDELSIMPPLRGG